MDGPGSPKEALRDRGISLDLWLTQFYQGVVSGDGDKDWLSRVGIQPIRIYPGSPWENGYNERFNGTLRREVLNAEWFATTRQAQVVINTWLRQYNHVRPHHALGMRPPVPETILEKPQISGPD